MTISFKSLNSASSGFLLSGTGVALNQLNVTIPAGYYKVTSFTKTGATATATTVYFVTSSGTLSVATSDIESSGTNTGPSINFINLPQGATAFYVASYNGNVVVEKISDSLTTLTGTATTYSTSQSIALPLGGAAFIIGGGGGGGAGSDQAPWTHGGGGGGGYRTSFLLPAGTYNLVVGAGGAGISSGTSTAYAGTGGTTTFAGYSAAGGTGGRRGPNYSNPGGTGGTNGGTGGSYSDGNTAGQTSYGHPLYATQGVGGTGSNGGGGGGGLGAGGNGGAQNNGGLGAGAGGNNQCCGNVGGNGGAGAAVVVAWS